MRALTILLVAVFMVAGLAMPVSAEPEPPGGCAEWTQGIGLVDVSLRRNCSLLVEADTTPCIPPSSRTIERNVDRHTVRVILCDGVGLPPLGTSAPQAQPCGIFLDLGLYGQAEIKPDCGVEVHLIDTYRLCERPFAGIEDDRAGAYVANNEVSVGYCYPDLSAVTPSGNDAADPFVVCVKEPCGPVVDPKNLCKPFVNSPVSVASDCHVTVTFDYMACLWGGHWTEETVGIVTVRVFTCDNGSPPDSAASASAQPCSLVPGDIVSDDCMTISIDLVDCFWGGYWHYYTTYPVTVREYRCGDPPQ